jgi:hypothetical protein
LAQAKACSPRCPAFKCAKNSAFYQRDGVQCRWTEELCNIVTCQYSMCAKRRLLPHGICGETVKRITVEKDFEDELDEPVRLKGKVFRKFGDREIY